MVDKIYLVVTNDEYELPVATARTMEEIAVIFKCTLSNVCKRFKRNGTIKRKYRIVEVELDEGD